MTILHYVETKSKVSTENDTTHKINFILKGVNHALVNGLRRVLMAEIPTVAFDDTYHDDIEQNSIQITKNISGIHNEFISHRLSLQPLCMYKNDSLKIAVNYDKDKSKFVYDFVNPSAVPIFDINITNDIGAKEKYSLNADNSLDISADMITIKDESEFKPVSEFIIPDYITGDYCLLHRLKQSVYGSDVDSAETLQVTMRPVIGTGQVHARHNPTGTVSYEFVKESDDKLEENFKKYMENLQQKRKEDGLEPFNDDDIKIFKDTFDVMGSERVYKKTTDGEPEQIKMCVESIGNIKANQLFYDALEIIQMRIYAILNSFEWNESEKRYEYNTNKISIQKNEGADYHQMTLFGEDHTIGNLFAEYLKKLFVNKSKFGKLLNMASYKLPHPLDKKIVVSMKLNQELDTRVLFAKSGLKTTSNPENIVIQLLMISASVILYDIQNLRTEFTDKSGIKETSFEVENDILTKSYFNRSHGLAAFLQ